MDRTVFLAGLKVFLGIEPDDDTKDEFLLSCIDGAIEMCQEYLGRDLDGGQFTETIVGVSDTLIVTNWPITEVTSITGDGGYAYPVESFGWSARRNVIRMLNCAGLMSSAPCSVTVAYSAGYFGDKIPQWVKTCVDYIAAALFNLAGQGQSVTNEATGAVKRISVPGVFTEEYDTSSSSSGGVDSGDGSFGLIPDVARQQLDFYRDKRIG